MRTITILGERRAWLATLLAAGCAAADAPAREPAPAAEAPVAAAALNAGEFEIQARTGAQGGNPSVVTLGDFATWSRIARSDGELDFSRPPSMSDRAAAFVRGGPIPAGQAFVVEGIDVLASAAGDSNGHGEVELTLGRHQVLHLRDVATQGRQWFGGRFVVAAGHEKDVSVRLANSSAADVRFHGRWIAAEPVPDAEFAPAEAPPDVARAAGETPDPRGFFLSEPRAVLQVRSGAGGGNPSRIDLLGAKSMYVKSVSAAPLSFEEPPTMKERSVAYSEGGLVPPGKVFVVTRVDYTGSAKGDSNGHGELIVSLKRQKVVAVRDAADPVQGTWTGRIEIAPGQESQVFVEIANSSMADVRITGEFVDAPSKTR